ncbi:hoar [Apocheima cinerarium nucleopolyhedrovirus]|uniref:hoar n=1 Tax=Apocheima cinerarium nucleopolyhedrovirus TaxID=307461 RepID=UPI0001D920D8|nr:hoar [Apocheima cinerarium nucleopolyhedrovirus]ADB84477.1 hoar [Apocheima cinerarium nucleopolyhedrovirus]
MFCPQNENLKESYRCLQFNYNKVTTRMDIYLHLSRSDKKQHIGFVCEQNQTFTFRNVTWRTRNNFTSKFEDFAQHIQQIPAGSSIRKKLEGFLTSLTKCCVIEHVKFCLDDYVRHYKKIIGDKDKYINIYDYINKVIKNGTREEAILHSAELYKTYNKIGLEFRDEDDFHGAIRYILYKIDKYVFKAINEHHQKLQFLITKQTIPLVSHFEQHKIDNWFTMCSACKLYYTYHIHETCQHRLCLKCAFESLQKEECLVCKISNRMKNSERIADDDNSTSLADETRSSNSDNDESVADDEERDNASIYQQETEAEESSEESDNGNESDQSDNGNESDQELESIIDNSKPENIIDETEPENIIDETELESVIHKKTNINCSDSSVENNDTINDIKKIMNNQKKFQNVVEEAVNILKNAEDVAIGSTTPSILATLEQPSYIDVGFEDELELPFPNNRERVDDSLLPTSEQNEEYEEIVPKKEIKKETIDYEETTMDYDYVEDIIVKEEIEEPEDDDCQIVSIEKPQIVIDDDNNDDNDCQIVFASDDIKPKQGFVFRINKRKRTFSQVASSSKNKKDDNTFVSNKITKH